MRAPKRQRAPLGAGLVKPASASRGSRTPRPESRFRAIVSGLVQMVGFRAFAESRAGMRGITGFVRNLPGGEVEVVAEGDRSMMEEFLAELRRGPSGARVRDVMVSWEQPRGEFGDFGVRYGAW